MNDKTIPIANIYYLLCYAWGHFDERNVVRVGELERLESVRDLLGEVLAEGTFFLARRGIDRGYRDVHARLAGIRGKIRMSETVKTAVLARAQLECTFQELSCDVLNNQILRSTLRSLLRMPELDSGVRTLVRGAYAKLPGVSEIALDNYVFERVQLDRNRRYYRFLMAVCRLIHEHLLVDEESGATQFADFSEERMAKLYEDFTIEFFRREQDRYRINRRGRVIDWVDNGTLDHQRSKIPRMEADVILEALDRRIVLDAKYYKSALVDSYGVKKLRSDHLYQLLAYVRNRDATEKPGVRHEGMLLYPKVDEEVAVDVCLEGFWIRARSIDLAQDWRDIHRDMLSVVE